MRKKNVQIRTVIYRLTVDIIGFQREDHATFKSGSNLMINQGNINNGIGTHTMKSSPRKQVSVRSGVYVKIAKRKLKSRSDRRAKVN